ncbi:recombinase family protein [Novosphingobium sp.]|uniref:recombinase family protein n=1 Tax=Novosphingobium sp. TaxID=1874826 RepID=UPI00345BACE5
MIYGYARVSTIGQDLAQQIAQPTAGGFVKIYREKIGGATAERPQLKRAIGALDDGNVVMVTATDHLARNPRDLLSILHAVKGAGVGFLWLAGSMVDIRGASRCAPLLVNRRQQRVKMRALHRRNECPIPAS